MKMVILTLTKGGKQQGLRIKSFFPESELYSMPQFCEEEMKALPIKQPLKDLVKEKFNDVDLMIFIMATGIAVRMIAPLLQHKGKDPAILVMDEGGRNIISLLSGHIGGANQWTLKLASLLNSNPVITTASDVKGVLSVDMFAQRNNCKLLDWEKAKKVTAHLVNGREVPIYTSVPLKEVLTQYYLVEEQEELLKYDYGIIISNEDIILSEANILQIYPQNLVVGVGCRKDTPQEIILEEIKFAFKELKLSINSIKKLVTVDIKKDEKGIYEVANFLDVPVEIIHREEIKTVEDYFETSHFVKETIGVGSVSCPCAFLGSNRGKILLEKWRGRGVTVSVAEMME